MWVEILLFLFMGVCAVCDGVSREIPLAAVWAGILAAAILRAQGITGDGTWISAILAILPGVLFWGLSLVTGQKVGYGDGWMLVMIGLFVGLRQCFLILLAALAAESVIALAGLAFGRFTKDKEIPFAPFLLFGMGVVLCF